MIRFTEHYFHKEQLLTEGGAYGHLIHPFEDNELSFANIKKMINDVLRGKMKVQEEKTDGQNIMVSWKDGKLIGARNKSHIKNAGQNALDIKGIANMFKGRGKIQEAFEFAMADLQNALSKLPPETLNETFQNGKKFISFEVMYPATENVIPYGLSMLIPHEVVEYDESGNPVGRDREPAKQLAQVIKDTNNDVQKRFQIKVPENVRFKIPKVNQQIADFAAMVDKIKGKMDDNDTIADYKKRKFRKMVRDKTKEFDYDIPKDMLEKLSNRLALDDKSLKMSQIKKQVDNEEFFNWYKNFESAELKAMYKQVIRPLEILFLKLGVVILKNIQNFLSANTDESAQKILQRLNDKIKEIESASDMEAKKKLAYELQRLNDIGGIEDIVPSEGIVFMYNGQLYKLTGKFSPLNSILGMGRYGR